METLIIWSSFVFISLVLFVAYFFTFLRRQRVNKERKQEAVFLGADKPITQHPQFDEIRCLGCGSCVAACPEGEVLGIVGGRSTVINGMKCIGHGLCAEACPIGAITIGLGDLSTRDDIPQMNEFNETNVQGIYIAGELSGTALIRNALTQGKMVMEKIVENNGHSSNNGVKDVIIIGAGPAGISAALVAIKSEISYLVLDQQGFGGTILQYPKKKLVMTKPVEIPLYGSLSKPEYQKEELMDIWCEIREKYKVNIKIGEKLIQVKKENGSFQVKTPENRYQSRNVVLALGRRGSPRKLGVPGEDLPKVMYKLMDAESYQNHNILIVGGGDSAIEAAIGLALQRGNSVTVSYRKTKFFRIKKKNESRINELINDKTIRVIFNSNVVEILQDSVTIKSEENTIEIPNDYVYVFAGGVPPFKLLQDMGVSFGKAAVT